MKRLKATLQINFVLFLVFLGLAGAVGYLWNELRVTEPQPAAKAANPEVEPYRKVGRGITALEEAFVKVAEEVKPTVVSIIAERIIKERPFRFFFDEEDFFWRFFEDEPFFRRFFGEENPFGMPKERKRALRGFGSGFIINSDGYILTNTHVVEGAEDIRVTVLDAKTGEKHKYKAKLIGIDRRTDLAVIKIAAVKDLPVATLGDSGRVKVGSWVLAIGHPFGYEHTVTAGIISAKHRTLPGLEQGLTHRDLLQTDASINRGNSGGPLVNLRGEVIGINVAIETPTGVNIGIGFAIPINVAKDVYPQLIKRGEVLRGYLGVWIMNLSEVQGFDEPRRREEYFGVRDGVYVQRVDPDTPAEKANIKPKDVIIEYDRKPIKDTDTLIDLVEKTPPGTEVKIKVMRNRQPIELTVKVAQMPKKYTIGEKPERKLKSELGIDVQELTARLYERYKPPVKEGVIIVDVEPGSPADDAGLAAGMIIVEIDRRPIRSMEDYEAALKATEKLDFVVVEVWEPPSLPGGKWEQVTIGIEKKPK